MSDGPPRLKPRRASAMASPCVNVCTLHPVSKLCVGCGRTGDEIAAWARLGDAGRAAVMAELPARMAATAQRPPKLF
ncbi:DUF1289 domain-containing protein [Rubrimonas cliftonensis]|uniref:DUF1289 domain-containing protein n=1 Tax=Rubrimonas cliftonensis TaxID=89524 RepID=A0A1H3Z2Z7_9RHOB|nr:DUF1289 domain-containing protein [Rubrimonas cliftonensis]SEA18030.1 hypothetical protein SAMN05444370_103364 [Rubrimonas cliftonensis]